MEKEGRLVIGIVGNQLSGKGTAAKFFVEKFKVKHFRFSAILDQVLGVLGLEITRENEQELGKLLREIFGEEALSQALIDSVKKSHADVVVVEGFRKMGELTLFKKEIENFKLIFIHTSPEVAHRRLQTRTEKVGESVKSLEEFHDSRSHHADKDVESLQQYADFVIENEGTLEEFHSNLTSAYTRSL